MNWLVDGLGILGILTNIIIYQQKTRKRLLIWKLISDMIWIMHYWLLGAYSVSRPACLSDRIRASTLPSLKRAST